MFCFVLLLFYSSNLNVFIVYLQVTGEKRALKVPKRAGADKATQRETDALLSFRHTNIVQLFGIEDEVYNIDTLR